MDAGPGGIIWRAPGNCGCCRYKNGLNGANCGRRNQYRGVWGNFNQLGGQVPEDESGLDYEISFVLLLNVIRGRGSSLH